MSAPESIVQAQMEALLRRVAREQETLSRRARDAAEEQARTIVVRAREEARARMRQAAGEARLSVERALAEIGPQFMLPYQPAALDLDAVFGRAAPRILEIGFGMGETTAAIAASRPDVNFLGVEVFMAGVGALLKRIDEQQLANVRVIHHDAVELLRDMIPPDSLAGVHVYFPDPWQKKRHHKRRLIAQPFVGRLASHIAPGGYLHCATDWEDYAVQMLEVLSNEPQLANSCAGYAPGGSNPIAQRPTTKFHARGERLGPVVQVHARGKVRSLGPDHADPEVGIVLKTMQGPRERVEHVAAQRIHLLGAPHANDEKVIPLFDFDVHVAAPRIG